MVAHWARAAASRLVAPRALALPTRWVGYRRAGWTLTATAGGVLIALQPQVVWPCTANAEASAVVATNNQMMLSGHDADAESQLPVNSWLQKLRIGAALGARFAFLSSLSASVFLPGGLIYFLPRWLVPAWAHELLWTYALWAIETAGPTYVKLGQWAASRPDMFPEEFCSRFSRLHDQVRPHAWPHTAATLEGALGSDWESRLVLDGLGEGDITREAGGGVIGSGCIAQVYRGYWFPAGRQGQDMSAGVKVAVKVCHPNIREKVDADLAILKWACATLEWWIPDTAYLGTLDVMTDFEQLMHLQMDLRVEAQNLRQFIANFAAEDIDVSFPEPIFSREELLVERFMEGKPISEFMSDAYTAEQKVRIANMGMQIALMMVFKHNFIHADLHPGNILVDYEPESKPDSVPSIVCLDAGLAYQVQRHSRMIQILTALIMRDGEEAGGLMLATDRENEERPAAFHSAEAVAAYCDGMQGLVDMAVTKRFFENLGEYIYRFFKLAFEHKVKLDHNFVCVAGAVKVVEGLALGLHPTVDLITHAVPYVAAAKVNEANSNLQARARRIFNLPDKAEVMAAGAHGTATATEQATWA